MSRVQLALNVSNLDEAIKFYSTLFKTQPAKIRAGYANFAVSDPPLKLVLIENPDEPGTINHLGVEVFSTQEVTEASRYLAEQGLATDIEEQTTCCFAVQDKVWVQGPDAARWEVYTVLADAPVESGLSGDATCCADATIGASPKVATDVKGSPAAACC
jgi:catechol 2,3-dioxygenase-like lactoylglutathione lyase family enzyme